MLDGPPLVAFHLDDEFDVASQLSPERGWVVPAYTLPPKADHRVLRGGL